MAKYQVVRAWTGVEEGDVVELASVHPALAAHVKPVRQDDGDDEAKVVDIVDEAKAEALRIVAEATLEARGIVDEAYIKAEEVMTKASQVVQSKAELTPATPPAEAPPPPTEPAKSKETKKAAT